MLEVPHWQERDPLGRSSTPLKLEQCRHSSLQNLAFANGSSLGKGMPLNENAAEGDKLSSLSRLLASCSMYTKLNVALHPCSFLQSVVTPSNPRIELSGILH